jgi:hypothetical protein
MHQWIVTAAKKRLDLDRPEEFPWDVECTAASLSKINRYTGHSPWPYSVAQHAVLVAEYVLSITNDAFIGMQGLHHDDPEIVTGDISSPVKAWLKQHTFALKDFETKLEQIVAEKLHLPWPYHPIVDEADKRIALNEKQVFFPEIPDKWQSEQEGVQPLPGVKIEYWSDTKARVEFLTMHARLLRRMT